MKARIAYLAVFILLNFFTVSCKSKKNMAKQAASIVAAKHMDSVVQVLGNISLSQRISVFYLQMLQ